MEPLGILTDFVVAVCVMFIAPIMFCILINENAAAEYSDHCIALFVDEMCTKGRLDNEMYNRFIEKMSAAKSGADIRITRVVTVYEPEYRNDFFTGKIMEYEREYYDDEVMAQLAEEEYLEFGFGEKIKVEVEQQGRLIWPGIKPGKRLKYYHSETGTVNGGI